MPTDLVGRRAQVTAARGSMAGRADRRAAVRRLVREHSSTPSRRTSRSAPGRRPVADFVRGLPRRTHSTAATACGACRPGGRDRRAAGHAARTSERSVVTCSTPDARCSQASAAKPTRFGPVQPAGIEHHALDRGVDDCAVHDGARPPAAARFARRLHAVQERHSRGLWRRLAVPGDRQGRREHVRALSGRRVGAYLSARYSASTLQRFGVDQIHRRAFAVGGGNREGLESGAFWFYYRLGFPAGGHQSWPPSPTSEFEHLCFREAGNRAPISRSCVASRGRTLRCSSPKRVLTAFSRHVRVRPRGPVVWRFPHGIASHFHGDRVKAAARERSAQATRALGVRGFPRSGRPRRTGRIEVPTACCWLMVPGPGSVGRPGTDKARSRSQWRGPRVGTSFATSTSLRKHTRLQAALAGDYREMLPEPRGTHGALARSAGSAGYNRSLVSSSIGLNLWIEQWPARDT